MATSATSTGQSSSDSGSDAPRTRGTRSRAGNAMGRTHDAAIRGALAAVEKYGSRKATMGDIAMLAGVAKATLYNHFRTREDVYSAVVVAEVDRIANAALAKLPEGFDVAVADASRLIGEHPAVRRIAADDPTALVGLATLGDGAAWNAARAHIAGALTGAGYPAPPAVVDLVLRYFVSQLLAPSLAEDRQLAAELLTSAVAAQPPYQPAPVPVGTEDTSN